MTTKATTLKAKFLKSAGIAGAMAVALTSLAAPAMADEPPQQRGEHGGRGGGGQNGGQRPGGNAGAQQGQPRPQMQQGQWQGQPRPQMGQPQGQPRQMPDWSATGRAQRQGQGQPQMRTVTPSWRDGRRDDGQRQQGNLGQNNRGPDGRGQDRTPDWARRVDGQGRDRSPSWKGNPSWQGQGGNRSWNNDARRGNDDRRWNNDGRRGNDDRRWNNDWRRDQRYDWRDYRDSHRDVYRGRPYYSPYRGYSYRRVGIGFTLGSLFYGSSYWLDDPWMYRLPPVYGPYRWVRYYDDVLLVDVYTGEVVDVIYDFFW